MAERNQNKLEVKATGFFFPRQVWSSQTLSQGVSELSLSSLLLASGSCRHGFTGHLPSHTFLPLCLHSQWALLLGETQHWVVAATLLSRSLSAS